MVRGHQQAPEKFQAALAVPPGSLGATSIQNLRFLSYELGRLRYITPSANIQLQNPTRNCRSHTISAQAMMWLHEQWFCCRIFIISFLRFCRNLNFLSNSLSFGASFTWDFVASSKIWFFWALDSSGPTWFRLFRLSKKSYNHTNKSHV